MPYELGRRGFTVHGVDISQRFVDLATADAPDGVTFERMDARHLDFEGAFDAAISLCQGAFGLVGAGPGAEASSSIVDPDGEVLAGMARAVRPGGAVAVSAFSAYFMVRFLEEHDSFDAARGREPRARRRCGPRMATSSTWSCGRAASRPVSFGCSPFSAAWWSSTYGR